MSEHYHDGIHSTEPMRGNMPPTQAKPSEEAFNRETEFQPGGSQRKTHCRTGSHQVLAHRVAAGGCDLYIRNLHTYACLAVWLVVAHGQSHSALSPDDSECLCDAGDLSVDCQPQTSSTLEPHLVHGVVQRRTRCSHGSAGSREP